jgi:hypothetical protein
MDLSLPQNSFSLLNPRQFASYLIKAFINDLGFGVWIASAGEVWVEVVSGLVVLGMS